MTSSSLVGTSIGPQHRRTRKLTLGLGGVRRHACAALADETAVLAVCEQERITRVRGAGSNGSGLPDEAIDVVLAQAKAARTEVSSVGVSEEANRDEQPWNTSLFDHHRAHAATAYLTSPFASAAVLICDDDAPGISVWTGTNGRLTRVEWPWSGRTPSELYAECARTLGCTSPVGPQRFEALARLMAGAPDTRLSQLFSTDGTRVDERAGWRALVDGLTGSGAASFPARARVAAALQDQVCNVLVELLRGLRASLPVTNLCVGGSLFQHSSINSRIRLSGTFDRVFVPADTGNAGTAVGAAKLLAELQPAPVSPFMGPSYEPDAVKATLDNCKLRYDWLDEGTLVEMVVRHLCQGRLVGWFEGRMEWGPRALGARSILASPFSPFVLENLSTHLKHREAWRGYAVSVLAEDVDAHFSGPTEAPFMESEYRPNDVARFRTVLPSESAHLRLHTVDGESPRRFRTVLDAFGRATGVPCLVNTSFNGFHEPIVCSPRDAVRVFFGSGLDVLVLEQFVLTK